MVRGPDSRDIVLVIGAQGVLGGMCADALREAGVDVIRAGRRPENAPDFRRVDLNDPASVAEGCSGVDLVVSTVRHPAHAPERFVLREGGTLLNLATLWASERAELAADAADARGLVVLDAGLAPGVTSLLLKEMLAEHPEADTLESAGTFSALEPSGRATAIDFLQPALTHARRHRTRVIEFPAPTGPRRCLSLDGPDVEAMVFGGLLAGRAARVYGCMIERSVNTEFLALNAVGLLSRTPVGLFTLGHGWKLRRGTAKPQVHAVALMHGEERLAARAVQCLGNYQSTAAALACFVQALLRRGSSDPPVTGVRGVEDVFDLSELRDDFEHHGIKICSMPI